MYIDIYARIGGVRRRSIQYWDDETRCSNEDVEIVLDAVREAYAHLGISEIKIK